MGMLLRRLISRRKAGGVPRSWAAVPSWWAKRKVARAEILVRIQFMIQVQKDFIQSKFRMELSLQMGLFELVVRDLLHWRINALTSSLPQLAQGRPREMATRPGHFCLSESNFLGSKWLFKPSYLKEYHAPQGQISGKITQLHGINYNKTFSPVGKSVTIWPVLSCLTGASLREGRKRIASLVYHASILAGMFSPQSHSFSLRHLIRDGMAYQWIYQSLPQQLMALARSKDIEGLACRAI